VHFEGPDAPPSFMIPEGQVDSAKVRSNKGLGKIGVPGSIKTYKKRVESTSQWASKAARKTAALPQKNINNAKKSIAKRLKSDADDGQAPANSPVQRRRHLKQSGGSMPSGLVRSALTQSMDGSELRAPRPSRLGVDCTPGKSEETREWEDVSLSVPIVSGMGSRSGSFDDLVLQEQRECARDMPLSPIQSHTYLLDSDSDSSCSPQKSDFLRTSTGHKSRAGRSGGPRTEAIAVETANGASTAEEGSDLDTMEFERSPDAEEFGLEEEIFVAEGYDEDEAEAGSPEYVIDELSPAEEALALYHEQHARAAEEAAAAAAAAAVGEKKHFNKQILSLPKGATKKSRKAGNYLLNMPKGVKRSVATGMDRASEVASKPGKKVSRMVKGRDGDHGAFVVGPDGTPPLIPSVSTEELQQFLQAGTENGKFVKAVAPEPGSHKHKKSLVRSVRGGKGTESGMDKKQLRKEVASIKQSMEQFNRVIFSNVDTVRANAEKLQQLSATVNRSLGSTEKVRDEGQQERLALHQELSDVSQKLDTLIAGMRAQQQQVALIEGRLMTVQRYQATQITFLGIVFMLVNWIVVGMSIVQQQMVMRYRQATGTLPPALEVPAIENSPVVEDVTDEEMPEPQQRPRSGALRMVDPVTFGKSEDEKEEGESATTLEQEEAAEEAAQAEPEEEDRPSLLGSSANAVADKWKDDTPPSVASVAAAHAAGILAEKERLRRQRAEGRALQGSTGRLRPSFVNSSR